MYSLFQIAKADFLQRFRSLAFLITMGAGIYLTYTFIPAPDASYTTVTLGNYQGNYTASWIGTVAAMMSSMFLALFGFYLVNDSVQRDYTTGVGQVIATTRTTSLQYMTGKAISNFFVLLILMFTIAFTATGLLFLYGKTEAITVLDLLYPFLWITVPTLLFIAAFSTFSECYRKINRGIINIIFLFVFIFFVALSEQQISNKSRLNMDLFATSQAFELLKEDLGKQVTDYNGKHSIGYTSESETAGINLFTFKTMHPGFDMILSRFIWIFVGMGLILLGARNFKRFDTAFEAQKRNRIEKKSYGYTTQNFISLPKPSLFFGLLPMMKAEGKLMLKGQSFWWWVLISILFIATVVADLLIAHKYLLPTILLLQINIWSVLGSREKIYGTEQIIFTAPKVLSRQLFAGWGAGILWTLVLSSAVLARLAIEHDLYSFFAVISGAIFLISLALISGIFTGGAKFFQVMSVIFFYGLIQGVPFLDYLGTTSTALNFGMPLILMGISLVMLLLGMICRRKQSFI